MKQYPHKITFTTVTGSTLNGSGDWTAGSETTVTKDCRAEINSKNGLIVTPGGTQIKYDWTVYMAIGSKIKPGTQVEVKDSNNEVLCKTTVKQFSQGQLNQRIWL
jgi:hypothetical protein